MKSKDIKKENDLIKEQYDSVMKEEHGDMYEDHAEAELGLDPTVRLGELGSRPGERGGSTVDIPSEDKTDMRDDTRHAYYELVGALHNKHLIRTDKHDPSLEADEMTIATGGRHSVKVRVLGYHKPHKP